MKTATTSLPTILLVDAEADLRRSLRQRLYYLAPHALVLEAPAQALALDLILQHCQLTSAPKSLLLLLNEPKPAQCPELLAHLTQLPTACYETVTPVVLTPANASASDLRWVQARAIVQPTPFHDAVLHELLLRYLPSAVL